MPKKNLTEKMVIKNIKSLKERETLNKQLLKVRKDDILSRRRTLNDNN